MTKEEHEEMSKELTDAILNIGRKYKAPYGCLMHELANILVNMVKVQTEHEQQKTSNN